MNACLLACLLACLRACQYASIRTRCTKVVMHACRYARTLEPIPTPRMLEHPHGAIWPRFCLRVSRSCRAPDLDITRITGLHWNVVNFDGPLPSVNQTTVRFQGPCAETKVHDATFPHFAAVRRASTVDNARWAQIAV